MCSENGVRHASHLFMLAFCQGNSGSAIVSVMS